MNERPILEDVIMQEISGKNAAIHAYDGIVWKIRSGYLALVFGGWAILLKGLADGTLDKSNIVVVVVSMFLVSLGMSFGGCFVDCNYVRRKFRVILALNDLIGSIIENRDNLNEMSQSLLKVAGHDPAMPYKCDGYQEAASAGKAVYFVPAVFLAFAVFSIAMFLK